CHILPICGFWFSTVFPVETLRISAPAFLNSFAIVITSSCVIPFSAQSQAETLTEIGLCFGKTFRISLKTRSGKRNLFSMFPPYSSALVLVKGDRKEAYRNP